MCPPFFQVTLGTHSPDGIYSLRFKWQPPMVCKVFSWSLIKTRLTGHCRPELLDLLFPSTMLIHAWDTCLQFLSLSTHQSPFVVPRTFPVSSALPSPSWLGLWKQQSPFRVLICTLITPHCKPVSPKLVLSRGPETIFFFLYTHLEDIYSMTPLAH